MPKQLPNPLTAEERRTIEQMAAAGNGPATIARALGRPRSNIAKTYAELQRQGRAPWKQLGNYRPWTKGEQHRLISMIEQGYSYEAIGRRLKRTRESVKARSKKVGVRLTKSNATLSPLAAAEALGFRCATTITRWIELGWLKARNTAPKNCAPRWRISWDDLLEFLETPDHWQVWQPERIPDLAMREWTQEIRESHAGYLSRAEVAAHFHVEITTVASWVKKKWIPSHGLGQRKIPASVLQTFTPPSMGGRRTRPEGRAGDAHA